MHWSPNFSAASLHERAVVHRRGVDRDLVGAGAQQRADVLDGAHAAADRHRHEAGFRRALHDVENGAAVFVAGRDVEEGQLVRARCVIGDRRFDRIAGIAQVDEIDALDDAAVLHVETGNDADLEHQCFLLRSNQPQRFGRIEPAVIECAAGDGAGEFSGARAEHILDVLDRSKAAGCDHGNGDSVRQRNRRIEVETLEHAVARHVGIDNRGNAGVLEPPAQYRAR